MYKIVVFAKTKGVCMPCRFTKRELEKHQFDVEERSIEALTDEELEMFKLRGMYSAPIVQIVADNGLVLDEWAGHNLPKLREYIKEV